MRLISCKIQILCEYEDVVVVEGRIKEISPRAGAVPGNMLAFYRVSIIRFPIQQWAYAASVYCMCKLGEDLPIVFATIASIASLLQSAGNHTHGGFKEQ